MHIRIIAVGKLKEKFFADAVSEYEKRLSRFAKMEIVQIPDTKIPEKASEAEEAAVLRAEGDKILEKIPQNAYVYALCVEGKQRDSEEFAAEMKELALSGKSDVCFIIGGSLGLDERVKARAQMRLSFSKMTFPHMLMRVVLLEQIYRAFKINHNESYHK